MATKTKIEWLELPGEKEQADLTRGLLDLAERGLRTRCQDPSSSRLWLSDDSRERELAGQLCEGCPLLRPQQYRGAGRCVRVSSQQYRGA
jgi:hypothetical protein